MTENKRTSEELFQEFDGRPLTSDEMLEMLQTNISYEEVKARSAERARINRLAERIEGTPLAEWPPFDVAWQLDPAQFYFVFDGAKPGSVGPDELRVLNDVPIAKIDGVLTPYWHRRADEVWSVGDARKAARIIVHWSEGRAMTPAIVAPTEDHLQLVIPGGNHRLAVARAKGLVRVPVLYRAEHETPILNLLGLATESEDEDQNRCGKTEMTIPLDHSRSSLRAYPMLYPATKANRSNFKKRLNLLAHPTRFERVTFAFGGQRYADCWRKVEEGRSARSQFQRKLLKGLALPREARESNEFNALRVVWVKKPHCSSRRFRMGAQTGSKENLRFAGASLPWKAIVRPNEVALFAHASPALTSRLLTVTRPSAPSPSLTSNSFSVEGYCLCTNGRFAPKADQLSR